MWKDLVRLVAVLLADPLIIKLLFTKLKFPSFLRKETLVGANFRKY